MWEHSKNTVDQSSSASSKATPVARCFLHKHKHKHIVGLQQVRVMSVTRFTRSTFYCLGWWVNFLEVVSSPSLMVHYSAAAGAPSAAHLKHSSFISQLSLYMSKHVSYLFTHTHDAAYPHFCQSLIMTSYWWMNYNDHDSTKELEKGNVYDLNSVQGLFFYH